MRAKFCSLDRAFKEKPNERIILTVWLTINKSINPVNGTLFTQGSLYGVLIKQVGIAASEGTAPLIGVRWGCFQDGWNIPSAHCRIQYGHHALRNREHDSTGGFNHLCFGG